MSAAKEITSPASTRSRAAAFIGLSVALIAISAWVTIPIGPVPFTMQMFAITMVICLLPTPWTVITIFAYFALGLIGVPVFSGFRGGIGVIMGPTGGFLLGYLIGVTIAAVLVGFVRTRIESAPLKIACEVGASLVFVAFAYLIGCIQYSEVASIGIGPAFALSCAPFIVPDIIKVVAGVLCAQPIAKAVRL